LGSTQNRACVQPQPDRGHNGGFGWNGQHNPRDTAEGGTGSVEEGGAAERTAHLGEGQKGWRIVIHLKVALLWIVGYGGIPRDEDTVWPPSDCVLKCDQRPLFEKS